MKPARNTCAVVVAQQASGGDRPGMPSGSPSDSDCIPPHPLPHTSRHPSSHAHSLRTGLSGSRNPSYPEQGREAASDNSGGRGVWRKDSWLWTCHQEVGVRRTLAHGGMGRMGCRLTHPPPGVAQAVGRPLGYSFHQWPTLCTFSLAVVFSHR